ncbi:Crp/Fnr family transcriptional regulator [Rhodopseudomonas palustris]|uniref:Transcriptional regulator, Crp/Fnr family n=1 Tax=Rhodopseudomonas palustris (strain BisB18) TaxID=316056 RepID=Q214V2_RHOPB
MIQSRRNRLLEMLPRDDLNRLRPHLHSVVLDYKMPLYEAFAPINDVYFPVDGVASLVSTMADGSSAEIGTIGNEGIVGTPIILGDTVAPTNVYVQVPGHGLKLKAEILRQALQQSVATRTLMLHYVHAFFNQVAQSAVCNHFHSIEQRCCRWLLMTHDRVQAEDFLLTQEFLAMMLGARRSSVTEAAKRLKNRGLISYVRGHVTMLDRAGIERTSCECYAVSKAEFDRLLGAPKGLGATLESANG